MTRARVLVCGCWDEGEGYPRPRSLLDALARLGVAVTLCRVAPPEASRGQAKQRLAGAGPIAWLKQGAQVVRMRQRVRSAVRAAVRAERPDAILVPYPGHLVMRAVRSAFDGPILLDLFLSVYDTAVVDRQMFAPHSRPARLLRWVDRRACEAADTVFLDTPEHAAVLGKAIVGDPKAFGWVPIGDPWAPRSPMPYLPPLPGERLRVLFFGTGVPLHGLPCLIEAVGRAPSVELILVGGTPADRALAVARLGSRVTMFPQFMARSELAGELERCHLVAGVFGSGRKAERVVPFKVVHALAAGRPVLTAATPAVRRQLRVGQECAAVPAGNALALAAALERLAHQPGRLVSLARRARVAYERAFSEGAIACALGRLLADSGVISAEFPAASADRSAPSGDRSAAGGLRSNDSAPAVAGGTQG